jgi:hypothetical protein
MGKSWGGGQRLATVASAMIHGRRGECKLGPSFMPRVLLWGGLRWVFGHNLSRNSADSIKILAISSNFRQEG